MRIHRRCGQGGGNTATGFCWCSAAALGTKLGDLVFGNKERGVLWAANLKGGF